MTVSLLDVIDTPHAILRSQGETLYGAILPHIRNNEPVQVDMTGIRSLTSNFLARSVDRLCNEYDYAAGLIEFVNCEDDYSELIDLYILQ